MEVTNNSNNPLTNQSSEQTPKLTVHKKRHHHGLQIGGLGLALAVSGTIMHFVNNSNTVYNITNHAEANAISLGIVFVGLAFVFYSCFYVLFNLLNHKLNTKNYVLTYDERMSMLITMLTAFLITSIVFLIFSIENSGSEWWVSLIVILVGIVVIIGIVCAIFFPLWLRWRKAEALKD